MTDEIKTTPNEDQPISENPTSTSTTGDELLEDELNIVSAGQTSYGYQLMQNKGKSKDKGKSNSNQAPHD